jgi:hypothetical protein
MSVNDAIHTRVDSLETAIRLISDCVVALADFMERLVVLKERNSFVVTLVQEVKEAIGEFKKEQADPSAKRRSWLMPVRNLPAPMTLASRLLMLANY